ncbi:NAD(P)-binding protein [Sporormia fimetaria CBS 119925]|uniref:NAD(P)-binding protein n=1 Tax=Sporormia fimetaria CBS 119925 TaxID=1340428 RepID=A0A6A6V9L2_9PLEO|nr:NAD(P)-binding protein [Sporormia fimetaria CBS 119925]
MDNEIKTVILVGASGNAGRTILTTFLSTSPFTLSILTRPSSTSTFPPNVRIVKTPWSHSLEAPLSAQKKLIDAAIAASVKRFIPSEFGSNSADVRVPDWVPFLKEKREIVEYLREKEKQSHRLSWSALITGPFFDWCLLVGFFGFDLRTKTATLIDGGAPHLSATNLRQVGLALISILKNPTQTANQYLYISGFETSQREILAVLEKLTDEKWTVKNVSSEELVARGQGLVQKGDFSGFGMLVQAGIFGKMGLGDNRGMGYANEVLGLEKEDLEKTVKTVLGGKLVGQE